LKILADAVDALSNRQDFLTLGISNFRHLLREPERLLKTHMRKTIRDQV
jgi:hypothetical protein